MTSAGRQSKEPRSLLVASTGGHLAELHRLRGQLDDLLGRPLWVTSDSAQSRELLAGEEVIFVPVTRPRDAVRVARNMRHALAVFRHFNVVEVVSTGSAVALSFIPLASALGIRTHFVESAARRRGPSLTGRMLACIRPVNVYTQCSTWIGHRWVYRGSVFDDYSAVEALHDEKPRDPERPISVVVTFGTMEFPFNAALDALRMLLDDSSRFDVRWQLGHTPFDPQLENAHSFVSPGEIRSWMRDADVVIAHAGLGSALEALDAGRSPLLIPRRNARGEHVDDHQAELAEELSSRGLAVLCEAGDLRSTTIQAAVGKRVVRVDGGAVKRFSLSTALPS